MAIYSGRASDFPVGSPLSQIQPLDAFVFAGPGNKPSANLTETLIPGRLPYQLSYKQVTSVTFNICHRKDQIYSGSRTFSFYTHSLQPDTHFVFKLHCSFNFYNLSIMLAVSERSFFSFSHMPCHILVVFLFLYFWFLFLF